MRNDALAGSGQAEIGWAGEIVMDSAGCRNGFSLAVLDRAGKLGLRAGACRALVEAPSIELKSVVRQFSRLIAESTQHGASRGLAYRCCCVPLRVPLRVQTVKRASPL
jgi:hypothetical protein